MSVGNAGAVKVAMDQMIATGFNNARGNQAMAMSSGLAYAALTRADFVNTLNAKLIQPAANALVSTTVNLAYTGAANIMAIWVDNAQAAVNYVQIYASVTTVTVGTATKLIVPVAASAQTFMLLPQPMAIATGVGWLSCTSIEGSTPSTTSAVTCAFLLTV